jgi:hypothetical protein
MGLQCRGQLAMLVLGNQAVGMAADEIVEARQAEGAIGSGGLLAHGVARGGGNRRWCSTFVCRSVPFFTAVIFGNGG